MGEDKLIFEKDKKEEVEEELVFEVETYKDFKVGFFRLLGSFVCCVCCVSFDGDVLNM